MMPAISSSVCNSIGSSDKSNGLNSTRINEEPCQKMNNDEMGTSELDSLNETSELDSINETSGQTSTDVNIFNSTTLLSEDVSPVELLLEISSIRVDVRDDEENLNTKKGTLDKTYASVGVSCDLLQLNMKQDNEVQELQKKIESLTKEISGKNAQIDTLKDEVDKWKNKATNYKSKLLNVSILKQNPESCSFYTGFAKYETFSALLEYLEDKASDMKYWDGKKSQISRISNQKKPGCKRQLTIEEEFFLVLLRLRLGMPLKELSRIYYMSEASISNIITTWIHLLYYDLQLLQPFPSKAMTDVNRPLSFIEYPTTRIIIDCTEFRVERPSSILAQRTTFSSYKNYNTFKCLIGVSPGGMVTFVSKLYGGATSDRFIVEDCKVLELMGPGDDVMADKGFEIHDIMPKGVTLNIPPQFRPSKEKQMPAENVAKTKSIAKVRVHVERAIRRVKTFHIFDSPIPLTMADQAEKIVMVCALLTNFMPALIKGDDMSLIDDPL